MAALLDASLTFKQTSAAPKKTNSALQQLGQAGRLFPWQKEEQKPKRTEEDERRQEHLKLHCQRQRPLVSRDQVREVKVEPEPSGR